MSQQRRPNRRRHEARRVAPTGTPPRSPWRDFGAGLALTAVLILAKIAFEHTAFGRQIEHMTLSLQQLRLAALLRGDLPVVVVDISDVPRTPRTAGDVDLVTDRRALIDIVAAIADRQPAAIGIDVLLDPPAATDPLTPDETALLDVCLAQSARVPTYVGIFDGVVRGERLWLGKPEYGGLAAIVMVPRPSEYQATSAMAREVTVNTGEREARIKSMAHALASAAGTGAAGARPLGRFLAAAFPALVEGEREVRRDHFETTESLVDFGSLPALMKNTVRASTSADVAAAPVSWTGKIVLIGRGQIDRTADVFTVPAQPEPIAGVYVHAAAAHTFYASPLFQLTPWGRVAADTLAALIPLGFVLWLSLRRRAGDDVDLHRTATRLNTWTALGVFVLGYFWIVVTGLVWTDYLMVVAALLLHAPLERFATAVVRRMRGRGATAVEGGHV